jgi:hypothetical protein
MYQFGGHQVEVCDLLFVIEVCINFVLIDGYELFVTRVDEQGRDDCVWLGEKQPVGVLALEHGEVLVEEGGERLEVSVGADLSFGEVSRVNQVVHNTGHRVRIVIFNQT